MSARRTSSDPSLAPPSHRSSPSRSGEHLLGQGPRDHTSATEVRLTPCEPVGVAEPHTGSQRIGWVDELRPLLGATGLFIVTDAELPIGTRLALEINLSKWTKLCVSGRVHSRVGNADDPNTRGIEVALDHLSHAAESLLKARFGGACASSVRKQERSG